MEKTILKLQFLKFIGLLMLSIMISCSGNNKGATEQTKEATLEEEQTDEWISLFDGKTLNGWKRYNADNIGDLWKVEDGMIVCYSEGGGEATSTGGSLITVEQFDNFELMLDWKISPTGNSGLLYHIVEDTAFSHAYITGPEYQLVDDDNFPSESGLRDVQKTAANYDMYPASPDKKVNPPGEWNTAKIIYDNGHVEHWLNGEKVLEFEEGSDDWKSKYENSKWVDYQGWCEFKKGSIGLQDHGNYTWFKNIKIKKL